MGGFAADDRSRTQALFEFLREIMLAAAIRELIIGVLELYWPGPDNDARAPQISATLLLRGIVGSLAISCVHVGIHLRGSEAVFDHWIGAIQGAQRWMEQKGYLSVEESNTAASADKTEDVRAPTNGDANLEPDS